MYKLLTIVILVFGIVLPTKVTYYDILGITKQAPVQDIRQAYKKLAVKYHPDKNPNAEDQKIFLKITEAYETLKDPEKRRKYDLYGVYGSYTRQYDYNSQEEYNKIYYNGLYHDDPYVETVTGQRFNEVLIDGLCFVNFYSPFCPPCQNLADIWKKLAARYKGIVKIGAVNCKYHNHFCSNSMRISSYPTLLFYPNGKLGKQIHYRGAHTLRALDTFIMTYVSRQVHVPTVSKINNKDKFMAYVLGYNKVDGDILDRIAFHLKGLVTIAIVDNNKLHKKLTSNQHTTMIYKHNGIHKEIQSTDEDEILKEILDALPDVEKVDPEKLKKIRNKLRNSKEKTWALYFAKKDENNKLLLLQMASMFPNMNFGTVDCSSWAQLCAALHAGGGGAWGALKAGGAYQRAHSSARVFLLVAARARRLHTLSSSEVTRVLAGGDDVGVWVVLVVPYQTSWDEDEFSRTSLNYLDTSNINFGIFVCNIHNEEQCRALAGEQPAVIMQNRADRQAYSGDMSEQLLVEFINLARDKPEVQLNEGDVMNILHGGKRARGWLVAHLPAHCPRCPELVHQFRIVANKLKPLNWVRVGVLQCSERDVGLCGNVLNPTARYYPLAAGHHYTVDLRQLSQAPYILEWALEYIDDTVQKLNWQVFTSKVFGEEAKSRKGKDYWLVYFHSPRCYRCYEMYADFAIAGILLKKSLQVGKVNCITERKLCQHESISSYPTMRLYLKKNKHRYDRAIDIHLSDLDSMLVEIRTYLMKHGQQMTESDYLNVKSHFIHDEF